MAGYGDGVPVRIGIEQGTRRVESMVDCFIPISQVDRRSERLPTKVLDCIRIATQTTTRNGDKSRPFHELRIVIVRERIIHLGR